MGVVTHSCTSWLVACIHDPCIQTHIYPFPHNIFAFLHKNFYAIANHCNILNFNAFCFSHQISTWKWNGSSRAGVRRQETAQQPVLFVCKTSDFNLKAKIEKEKEAEKEGIRKACEALNSIPVIVLDNFHTRVVSVSDTVVEVVHKSQSNNQVQSDTQPSMLLVLPHLCKQAPSCFPHLEQACMHALLHAYTWTQTHMRVHTTHTGLHTLSWVTVLHFYFLFLEPVKRLEWSIVSGKWYYICWSY